MLTFGGIMKIQMEKLGIKQETLAKDLNIARTTVTSYCNDKRQPDFVMQAKICQYLNINLSKVLGLLQYENEDLILHDEYEYRVNQYARKIKKENQAKFIEALQFLANLMKDE